MLVDDVRGPASHRGGRNDLEIRVYSLDRIIELSEPPVVTAGSVKEIFIPDLNILQRERFRMTVGSSLSSPSGIGTADHILDFIQCILHVRRQIRAWVHVFAIE